MTLPPRLLSLARRALMLAGACAACFASAVATAQPADLVITNAKIATLRPNAGFAQANSCAGRSSAGNSTAG